MLLTKGVTCAYPRGREPLPCVGEGRRRVARQTDAAMCEHEDAAEPPSDVDHRA